MKCPNCNYNISDDSKSCPICGYAFTDDVDDLDDNDIFSYSGKTINKYLGKAEKVIIPDYFTTIGKEAFKDCDFIEEVVFGQAIRIVEEEAFAGCTSLKEVDFNEGLEEIGRRAFFLCKSIEYIEFPSTLLRLRTEAFANCTSLSDVYAPCEINILERGVYKYCSNLYSVDIPKVEYVPEELFYGCAALTGITIPSSITSIRKRAIYGTGITTINIPRTVREISSEAFDNELLEEINVDKNNKEYFSKDGVLFKKGIRDDSLVKYPENKSDTTYNLPTERRISVLCENSFKNVKNLRVFSASNNLGCISNNVFVNCEKLESVLDIKGVTSMDRYAFYMCPNLCHIDYSKELLWLEANAISACSSLKTITVHRSCSVKDKAVPDGCVVKKKIF